MSLINRIKGIFAATSMMELYDGEVRARYTTGEPRAIKRKTKRGAQHKHRLPGAGRHRRRYLRVAVI